MSRILSIGILLAASLASAAQSDMPKPAYDFSLPREDRIKLAESAAPAEISSHASVYVLEQTGYAKIREGTNGFSCLVDRKTPLNLEPTCFDAEGSSTTLPTRLYVEEQRAKGKGEEPIQIVAMEIDSGIFSREISLPTDVEPEAVRAEYKEGFLWIYLPFRTQA